jgi:hypothetical protein
MKDTSATLIKDLVQAVNKGAMHGLDFDPKFPKKRPHKEKPSQRVVITGSTSWKNIAKIKKELKRFKGIELDYVVTGTSRGAEQLTVQAAKALGILLYQAHPWRSDSGNDYVVAGKVLKIFKPTLVIAFNEDPEENRCHVSYEKLCHRAGIQFKVISR